MNSASGVSLEFQEPLQRGEGLTAEMKLTRQIPINGIGIEYTVEYQETEDTVRQVCKFI